MRTYPKEYVYTTGHNPMVDRDHDSAQAYGKVRLGKEALFFKAGFREYAVPFSSVQRVFRRMDMVYGKLCCGGSTYDVQMLVLLLKHGTELEIHIGDDMEKQAQALYAALQEAQPQLQYGKLQAQA